MFRLTNNFCVVYIFIVYVVGVDNNKLYLKISVWYVDKVREFNYLDSKYESIIFKYWKYFLFLIYFSNTKNKIDIYSGIAERENENSNIEVQAKRINLLAIKKKMF